MSACETLSPATHGHERQVLMLSISASTGTCGVEMPSFNPGSSCKSGPISIYPSHLSLYHLHAAFTGCGD